MKTRDKKIQITLLLIGLFLIIATYFYYPYAKKVRLSKNQPVQENIKSTVETDQSTSFENVEYKGLYDLDKPFSVRSEKAHILSDEPDVMYMTNMHVILYLSDERVVNIMSDKGRYNKITYDCFFEVNVRATDGETKIFAENLDLLATGNAVEIYNNVSLYYPTGSLWADKIDYDFETKHFKVSMFDDNSVLMKVTK
mgnify:CR=1 FL=1|tara:strand:- start:390 stop:980 length:591 start_codon:yes stop_codon:yes gene_type:complete